MHIAILQVARQMETWCAAPTVKHITARVTRGAPVSTPGALARAELQVRNRQICKSTLCRTCFHPALPMCPFHAGCPKCASTNSGQRSCCSRGGSWFKNCGNSGDPRYAHTWVEGIEACRRKLTPDPIQMPTRDCNDHFVS